MVTTMDGQFFPQILQDGFDRILVDVPCSSDGTMRKEPKVLHRWKVLNGLNHHGLQVSLLSRGIELLKPGGRLIYSTCSLNPMECEAVVQTALLRFGPQLSLLPLEEVLPLGSPRGAQGLEDWFLINSGTLEMVLWVVGEKLIQWSFRTHFYWLYHL